MSLPAITMSAGCLERIQTFLLSDSISKHTIHSQTAIPTMTSYTELVNTIELPERGNNSPGRPIISVENVSLSPSSSALPILQNINFQAAKGSLTMVIGVVGSGKSTVLKAMIGEIACSQGFVTNNAMNMAYCSQGAWLQNSSVKNIVCGPISESEIDYEWYATVIHSCAFDEDVLNLPNQHDTIIGSRGVTLSGGQRQRLALARAIYARRELVVLDDVLSALDGKTQQLVVDRVFGKLGLFRVQKSTVILATHSGTIVLSSFWLVLTLDSQISTSGRSDHRAGRW